MEKLNNKSLLIGLVVVGLIACWAIHDASAVALDKQQDGLTSSLEAKASMPKLFEFSRFKTMFHKKYSTFLEEMRRMKIFLGRALDAFISMVRYKRGDASSCRTITSMSDYTDEEARKTFMRPEAMGLDAKWLQARAAKANASAKKGPLVASVEDVQKVLATIEQHRSDPKYSQAASELEHALAAEGKRMRRSIEDPSKITMDDLFRPDDSVDPSVPEPAKPSATEESNNPWYFTYVPPEVEASSETSVDPSIPEPAAIGDTNNLWYFNYVPPEVEASSEPSVDPSVPEPVKPAEKSNHPHYFTYVPPEVEASSEPSVDEVPSDGSGKWDSITSGNKSDSVEKFLEEFDAKPALEEDEFPISDEPDEIFVDLRSTGCLNPVRNQGDCGACYIFATTALHEYWHCKLTGNTQLFSEQYAIDCGGHYGADGCSGGDEMDINTLYNMCGLELQEHYPYKGVQGTCPYDPSRWDARRQMGWWRYSGTTYLQTVPYDKWPESLEQGRPLLVDIFVHPFFAWQGPGVDRASGCGPSVGGHAMLLIGHGREKGREYWLFRNSHGASWGHFGYYKMDKRAAENCLLMMSGRELDIRPDSSGFLFSENTRRNGTLSYKMN